MLPRERVIAVIEHRRPDRIPIYGWVRANLEGEINRVFGSVEAFEDRYEFDFAHLFGGPNPYPGERLEALRQQVGGVLEPAHLLDLELGDPDQAAAYGDIAGGVRHHKEERGRFVYVQTPGIFECLNGPFGIENHLGYLLLHEPELHQVYRRQAHWNRTFAHNCLDLGVDMVHVSDDWGGQHGLLFSPAIWERLIRPYHEITCRAVKERGAYLSLHSDGNVWAVVDGIVALGFDVVHPWQESAGMDLARYQQDYARSFVVMGGLDVQRTIGFGQLDRVRVQIERVMGMFAGGGLLFCTSHFVQDHCTIEELTFAFETAYEVARRVSA
ncbi:MAG: uroporphyrinogen decarboxylase family protein [Candidatus Latescibacterota bacterium]